MMLGVLTIDNRLLTEAYRMEFVLIWCMFWRRKKINEILCAVVMILHHMCVYR